MELNKKELRLRRQGYSTLRDTVFELIREGWLPKSAKNPWGDACTLREKLGLRPTTICYNDTNIALYSPKQLDAIFSDYLINIYNKELRK